MIPKNASLTYDQVRTEMIDSGEACNLLIGNGFSIAFDKMFGIDESDNDEAANWFVNLFASKVSLKRKANTVTKIKINKADIDSNYRNVMFWQVARKHPEDFRMIRSSEAASCIKFLRDYLCNDGRIFTLNYDLLLYWAFVRNYFDGGENIGQFELYDGFSSKEGNRLYWNPDDSGKQNIYYCHGALNLNEDNANRCYRSKYDMLSIDSVKSSFFDRGKIPLIVSAKSSEEKENQINKNTYLQNCLDEIKKLSGNLVILGLSLTQNDAHIIKALREAQQKNKLRIYYGFYTEDSLYETIKEISSVEPELEIYGYYDSSTAEIWRPGHKSNSFISKYAPLGDYLRHHENKTETIELTVEEIERILNSKLPNSAFRNKGPWWANDKTHPQAFAWISAGYKTSIKKLENEKIIQFIPQKE